ncbi:retrotransposon protein, putative, ty3-gypsy subclass [Tanacetum coccineum]
MRIDSLTHVQIKEARSSIGRRVCYVAIVQNIEDGKHTEFSVDDDGVVWFEDRLCVPNDQVFAEEVMTEAHSSLFTIHLGSTKMYKDLKQYFWWNGMKQDVATFVSKCMTCQQVKIEHQRASGLLQPLEIPVWKWDRDFHGFRYWFAYYSKDMMTIWVVVIGYTIVCFISYPFRRTPGISSWRRFFEQEKSFSRLACISSSNRMVSQRGPHSRLWEDYVEGLCFGIMTVSWDVICALRELNGFGIIGPAQKSLIHRGPFEIWNVFEGFVTVGSSSTVIPHSEICLLVAEEDLNPFWIVKSKSENQMIFLFVKILGRNHPEREGYLGRTEDSIASALLRKILFSRYSDLIVRFEEKATICFLAMKVTWPCIEIAPLVSKVARSWRWLSGLEC